MHTFAIGLGAIKRQIGVFHKLVRPGAVRWRNCDTDACSDDDLMAIELIWRADRINQTFCERDCVGLFIEWSLQDRELIATQSCDRIRLADASAHALSDCS